MYGLTKLYPLFQYLSYEFHIRTKKWKIPKATDDTYKDESFYTKDIGIRKRVELVSR